jgi:competence ComEA-like helix-hairpin-helix protein
MSVQTQASGPPTNINTASTDTLATNVMGIGPTLAQRIVAYREAHGSFSSVDELVQVSGIGDVLLARFRDQITVGDEMAVEQDTGNDAGTASVKGGSMADENRNEEEQGGEQISEGEESQRPDAVVPWAERLPAGDEDFSEEVEPELEAEAEAEAEAEPESEIEPELAPDFVPEPPESESESELEEPEVEAEAGLEPEFEEPESETEAEAGLEPEFEEPEMETEPEAEAEPEKQESGSSFVTQVEGPETVDTSREDMEEEEVEAMSADAMTMTGAERGAADQAEARPEPEPVVQYLEQRSSPWRSVLLVLLGGIAGVLLTLLVAVVWTGTVNFAPRAEVDALSRNLDTIYGNQELAWERIDQLVTRANELESEVTQLRALRDQFGAMEGELQAAQADVEAAQAGLTTLQQELGQLESDLLSSIGEVDQRVQGAEGDIADMSASLQTVETQVERVGVFFGALRDLLIDMEGMPETTPED